MRKKIQKKINFFKFSNCYQANEQQILKGYHFFENNHPMVLELGCGKATFSIELARKNPNINFIAIDTKINRLADGAWIALQENLPNIVFIQMHIEQILLHFEPQSVDKIWITFPDPYPKDRQEKHRLTNLKFLNYFHHLLKPKGHLLFKTDNRELFDYTLNILKNIHWEPSEFTFDLYSSDLKNEENTVLTEYEKKFLNQGKKICYLKLENATSSFQEIPLEPIPVFSPIKKWNPSSEIWKIEILKPYQNHPESLVFEEYDINMQFARTHDFEKYFWILVKGEIRVEKVCNSYSEQVKFHEYGQIIDFQENEYKLYAITIQRTQLIKIPKNL